MKKCPIVRIVDCDCHLQMYKFRLLYKNVSRHQLMKENNIPG